MTKAPHQPESLHGVRLVAEEELKPPAHEYDSATRPVLQTSCDHLAPSPDLMGIPPPRDYAGRLPQDVPHRISWANRAE